jgi:hypothetical protein
VAIVQISRITNRKGLTENLPQLAGAELGWCIDSRRLFIGNGTLQEGAPVIGNTEILTQYSDITVLSNYTYEDIAVGYAAQTGPTAADPVVRTVQAKLDDFASVRDFGAVGDGVADDTQAINRALFQLYCRETNTQIRRTLYFPAGTYKVTESIIIPTYAKLVGEGANCSIILLDTSSDISSLSAYVARYGDSLQQTGANIGNNSATPPRNIEISSMTFQSLEVTDIFLVENAQQCWFQNVNFIGPITGTEIADPGFNPGVIDIHAVEFASVPANICNQITFDQCQFSNVTYAINTTEEIQAITITNSKFTTLYQGVVLTANPTGVRVLHNIFDEIYYEGAIWDANLNVSGYNLYLNVGLGLIGSSPISPCITFDNDLNVSLNDLFARTDADALIEPRIFVAGISSLGTSGGSQLQLGSYARENGRTQILTNNVANQTVFSVNSLDTKAFRMDYTIVRATTVRHGTMIVVTGPSDDSTSTCSFSDDYVDNFDTGVTLSAIEASDIVTVRYSTTNTGNPATLTYSVAHLA